MKTLNKTALRKCKHHIGSLIATVIIIAIAVSFFIILKTVTHAYERDSLAYYQDHALADLSLLTHNVTPADIDTISRITGIKDIFGRTVFDVNRDDTTLRLISIPSATPKINIPYVYEGALPQASTDCAVLKKYADKHDLRVGDSLSFTYANATYNLRITALIATPEYVYLSKNSSVPIADPMEFGIMLVNHAFIDTLNNPYFTEVLVSFNNDADKDTILANVKSALGASKIIYETKLEEQLSYSFYEDDLQQFDTFSYIFPIVFFFIASIIILVLQQRNIIRDRRTIGIMKALGLSDKEIFWIYEKNALWIAAVGSFVGLLISVFVGPRILVIFSEMIELPQFTYLNIYSTWIIPVVIAGIVCLYSSYLALRPISKSNPAEAMHAEKPTTGRNIWLQKLKFWNNLSFNTRYAIKSALRNKGRFFAVVLGMVASVTLIVFSLGFQDTFTEIIRGYFRDIARYDVSIKTKLTPLSENPNFLNDRQELHYQKAYLTKAKLKKDQTSKDIFFYLSNNVFVMHDIRNTVGNEPVLQDGIAIPQYLAEQLDVATGDTLRLTTADKTIDREVRISDLTSQTANFYALGTFDYAQTGLGLTDPAYNTVFIKDVGDNNALKDELKNEKEVLQITTAQDDETSLAKMLDIFNVYIYLLVFFAIVLGLAVLYAISTINVLSRTYEFVLLKVMGYSTVRIMQAYIKELLFQMLIALPIGFIAGNLLLLTVNDAFSTDSFQMVNHIYPRTYWYAGLILLVVISVIAALAIRKINKLDLVQKLKEREE